MSETEKSPAFQWYPKDDLSSMRVTMMTLEEEGAYRRAMNYCWLHGFIPADTRKLALLIGKGCSPEVAEVVKTMFVEKDGVLIHERLDKEREKQKDWRQKSSLAGKKSAETRKSKGHAKTREPKNEVSTNVQPTLNQNPTLHSSSSSSFASSSPSSTSISSSSPQLPAEENENSADARVDERKFGKKIVLENKKKVPLPWPDDDFAEGWEKWKNFRGCEFGKYFRSKEAELAQLLRLVKKSGEDKDKALEIIEQSIGNHWLGLFELSAPKVKTIEQNRLHIPVWRKH